MGSKQAGCVATYCLFDRLLHTQVLIAGVPHLSAGLWSPNTPNQKHGSLLPIWKRTKIPI
ncbi:hypothetical protein LguiA_018571 [Lonicera macranthoides]